jgi:hypothetical protein
MDVDSCTTAIERITMTISRRAFFSPLAFLVIPPSLNAAETSQHLPAKEARDIVRQIMIRFYKLAEINFRRPEEFRKYSVECLKAAEILLPYESPRYVGSPVIKFEDDGEVEYMALSSAD